MDQYLSTVIIAVITGVFSIVTLIIQKKQDKVIDKIDEQTMFIEKEKKLKQKLSQKEKEREAVIHAMMILILNTNLSILKSTNIADGVSSINDVFKTSDELQKKFDSINKEIAEINKEYEMVLDLTSEIQKELEKQQSKKPK